MATNEDGLVRLWRWDRETLEFFDIDSPITFSCKFRARDRLRCSSFNYTGTQFAVAGDDGFVYVFSAVPVQAIHEGITTNSHDHSNNLQHQSQGGRGRRRVPSVLFPDKSGQTQAQPVVPIGILEGHMGSVTDLAYSHDGQRILSGYFKETFKNACIKINIDAKMELRVSGISTNQQKNGILSFVS
jgi:WD40 repeat protein